MKAKRKRAYISPDAQAIIIKAALQSPREQRTLAAKRLQEELGSKRYDVPEIETLERRISSFRRQALEQPQDKPWSMATLDEYPISPESIPTVLVVWKYRTQNHASFTIRDAKWLSRLSKLFQLDKGNILSASEDDIDALYEATDAYARTEQYFTILGEPLNTSLLDRSLMGLPIEDELVLNIPLLYASLGVSPTQLKIDINRAKKGKKVYWPDHVLRDAEKRIKAYDNDTES